MTGVLQLVLGLICVRHPDEGHRLYAVNGSVFHGGGTVPHRHRSLVSVSRTNRNSGQWNHYPRSGNHDLASDPVFRTLGDWYLPWYRPDLEWLGLLADWPQYPKVACLSLSSNANGKEHPMAPR